MSVNLNNMNETEFSNHLLLELYSSLTKFREMFNLPKLYSDDVAENAVKDYLIPEIRQNNTLDAILKEKEFCGKITHNFEINKNYPSKNNEINNDIKFTNFMRLFEEQFTSGKSALKTQDCSTHIAIGFSTDNNNNYTIRAVLSQKGISIESAHLLKDGVLIQGQMLQPNIYLFGIVLSKNKKVAPVIAGPSKINFDKNSGKFNIVLPSKIYGTPVALGMRKVSFHCKQTNNPNEIPYLDPNFDGRKIAWESYEVLLVQTFNFMKLKDSKKESIDKFLKPFDENTTANNINSNNNVNNINIQHNNNPNNLIGNDNISPINQNNNNNFTTGNQNNILNNNYANNNNNNHVSNFKNNLSNVLNSTNSKKPTNSFFNPNFMNNRRPGNNGMQMFGAIQEENSFMIGSVCNSNLNSIRKLNNNLALLSNSKMNPFNTNFQDNNNNLQIKKNFPENSMLNNNNINNLITTNQAMNNINNNLLNSNPLNKQLRINEQNMDQNNNNFSNQNNPNATNMNTNSLQNNIKSINMNSLNNFSNQNNQNSNNNVIRNSLGQNPFNQTNNPLNILNSNNLNMNYNNLNQNNFNSMSSINNNNNNLFNQNNVNNNNKPDLNSNQNQYLSIHNQQQNLNSLNNINNIQMNNKQMHPNNNMNMEILNNQRQANQISNNHYQANNINTNFSFNHNNHNNSNMINQNIMNSTNISSNNNYNRNYNILKSPFDLLFQQVTHYENLLKNEKQIIKAYNIPHVRFGYNASVSEMLNALPNKEDDVMHVNIKKTLAAGHEKFVISLDPFKTNNLTIRAKPRSEFADFIKSKINEKKQKLINNLNNNNEQNAHNNFVSEKKINNFNNNLSSRTNPFNLYDKNVNNNINNNINLNNSIQNQQQINLRYNENDSMNKMQGGNLPINNNFGNNKNLADNNMNKAYNYMENPSGRMFNNAHPNLLKSSVKFYQRERNAIDEYYGNSSLDRLYNYDNIVLPERENERANLNNLHKANKINNNNNNINNKFQINKEEYQKLSKSLFPNDSINDNYNNNNFNLNNKESTNNNNNNPKIKECKINLEKLEKEYLLDSDLKKEPNPVFVQLYKSQTDFDLILDINTERINAHKIVVLNQCNSIKNLSAVANNNNLNRGYFNEPVLIHLNKRFKKDIFKEVLKWLYCRKISLDINSDISALREMLFIAHELEIFDLQRILIIKHLLPGITKECSLRFLKDSHNKNVSSEITEVWKLLGQYSLIISGKNFSYLLKHARNQILGMETDLLFALIEEAIYFASEFSEVQNIIELVIESGFAYDVFELLGNLSKYYENARNFHVQNIDLKTATEKIDYLRPIELPLINDSAVLFEKFEEFKLSKSNSAANSIQNINNIKCNSNVNKNFHLADEQISNPNEFNNINSNNIINNVNCLHDNNTNNINDNLNIKFNKQNQIIKNTNNNSNTNNNNLELAKSKNEFSSLLNHFQKNDKNSCPSFNKVNPAHENLRKKKPNFTFRLNLFEELMESCSIISDAFNTKSNSWQLKIDIQKENGEISVFLVERGLPVLLQKNFVELKKKNTVKFTTVLFDIEVKDNSFEKNFMLFFSYLLNQNQIIGFENFFNLNQLDKKEQIFINVWVKEYALHSACLQYISNNFQNLVNNSNNKTNNIIENKQNELSSLLVPNNQKININVNQNNNFNITDQNKNSIINLHNNNYTLNRTINNGNGTPRTLFDVSIGDLACILFNDNLSVENENFVMSFIYKYCLKRSAKEIECLMNTIRFRFVDFRMLCIIARDHKVISKSFVYRKFFDFELKWRLGKRVDYSVIEGQDQIEKLSQQNKKIQSLGGQENNFNISLQNKLNSGNPFDNTKENKKENNNKQNLLFSDLKDSPFIPNLLNENLKNNCENSQIQNNFLNINLRNIEYIQSKARSNYKNSRPNHPIEVELGYFFFDSNHHSGYEDEIERLKKLMDENSKARERDIKTLQTQKKELEAEIQKINEREMRKRRLNNNNSNVSASIFNKPLSEENPKCVIF